MIVLNWIIYILYCGLKNLDNYLSGLKDNSWIVLLVTPIILVMFERQIFNIENSWVKTIFNYECLILMLFSMIAVFRLMLKLMIEPRVICNRIDASKANKAVENLLAIGSIVIIQLMNFIAVFYIANHRFSDLLNKGQGHVSRFYDIVYFTIVTYTSVDMVILVQIQFLLKFWHVRFA